MQATKTPITCEEPTCLRSTGSYRGPGSGSGAKFMRCKRHRSPKAIPIICAEPRCRRKTEDPSRPGSGHRGTGTGAKLLRCAEHRARRQRELTRRRVQAHRELEGPIPRRICIGTIPQHPNIPWKLWDEPCGNFTTEEGERRRGPRPHYCKAHKALQRKLKFFAREERKYDREGKEKQRYRNHKREAVRNISRIRGIPLDAAKGYHEAYHRIGPRYSNYAISQATRYGFSPEQIDLIASYIAGYRFGRADRRTDDRYREARRPQAPRRADQGVRPHTNTAATIHRTTAEPPPNLSPAAQLGFIDAANGDRRKCTLRQLLQARARGHDEVANAIENYAHGYHLGTCNNPTCTNEAHSPRQLFTAAELPW